MDSQQLFALNGFSGGIAPKDPDRPPDDAYPGKTDRKDPVLSPIFADLHGMPSTLLVTSTHDLLLSDTSMFHLALLHAGVDSQLLVFEALPHAFWYHFQLPETRDGGNIALRAAWKRVRRLTGEPDDGRRRPARKVNMNSPLAA